VTGGDPQRWTEVDPEPSGELRELLIAAFGKATAEHGYANLEIEHVLRHAGVSRAAFEAHFASMEQGLLAAQDAFFDRLWLDVAGACEEPGDWPVRVRGALSAVLASLVEASAVARVFAVEAAAASLAAAERQFAALERFAALLREGRRHYPAAAYLPEATERALVGGIASIVSGHLLMEDTEALPLLEPQLVELILIPYLGEVEARRVARA